MVFKIRAIVHQNKEAQIEISCLLPIYDNRVQLHFEWIIWNKLFNRLTIDAVWSNELYMDTDV